LRFNVLASKASTRYFHPIISGQVLKYSQPEVIREFIQLLRQVNWPHAQLSQLAGLALTYGTNQDGVWPVSCIATCWDIYAVNCSWLHPQLTAKELLWLRNCSHTRYLTAEYFDD